VKICEANFLLKDKQNIKLIVLIYREVFNFQ